MSVSKLKGTGSLLLNTVQLNGYIIISFDVGTRMLCHFMAKSFEDIIYFMWNTVLHENVNCHKNPYFNDNTNPYKNLSIAQCALCTL